MSLVLKELEKDDLERFVSEMQASFQSAVDAASEAMPLPVLPREDIIESLARPNARAYVAWDESGSVGGVVVFENENGMFEHECALLYIKANIIGGGIGAKLWRAIEEHYPDALSWRLCTPYFEIRNIYFYLRKCGFHIVDLFENTEQDGGPHSESETKEYMFTFLKRMDGCWKQ